MNLNIALSRCSRQDRSDKRGSDGKGWKIPAGYGGQAKVVKVSRFSAEGSAEWRVRARALFGILESFTMAAGAATTVGGRAREGVKMRTTMGRKSSRGVVGEAASVFVGWQTDCLIVSSFGIHLAETRERSGWKRSRERCERSLNGILRGGHGHSRLISFFVGILRNVNAPT